MSDYSKEGTGRQEPANDGATAIALPNGAGDCGEVGAVSGNLESAQSHEETQQEPHYRVELRIHCVSKDAEIPLGNCLDDGTWNPCEFVAVTSLREMAPTDVAGWLAGIDLMGMPLFDSVEEAVAAVTDTRQRCLLACRAATGDGQTMKEAGGERSVGGQHSN